MLLIASTKLAHHHIYHSHRSVICLQVRRNLHIVLSFSPVGEAFRERLRKFPSLVNCTTIDWFTAWPSDALATVATNFLAGLPGTDEKVREPPLLCCCGDSISPALVLQAALSVRLVIGAKHNSAAYISLHDPTSCHNSLQCTQHMHV